MNRRFTYIIITALALISFTATAQVHVGGNVYGGGNLANVKGNSTVTINVKAPSSGNNVDGAVYGGGALADVNSEDGVNATSGKNTSVTLTKGTVNDVYGGGLGDADHIAKVHGPVTVTINGGTARNVFGCNNVKGAPQNTVQVIVNDGTITQSVFGGGNLAAYTYTTGNYPKVNVINGTIGNIYGGGNGDPADSSEETAMVTGNPEVTIGDIYNSHKVVVSGNVYGGGNAAKVTGNTQITYNDNHTEGSLGKIFGGGNAAGVTGAVLVTMTLGKVNGGIYGGCNTKGNVAGDITVNFTGGTVGTDADHTANLHGGGYGNETTTSGNITVNFGTASNTHADNPVLFGDVYGGSGYGNVNASASNTTTVNILNGNVNGSVYGGGLGDKISLGGDHDYAALVNGVVHVNIGTLDGSNNPTGAANITGDVFGCNNINGSPQNNVFVDVYQTAHTTQNTYPFALDANPTLAQFEALTDNDNNYALRAVYGCGNKAGYTATGCEAKVYIHTCVNTIMTAYGGGNAANATNVRLVIDGGRFRQVFGGGNGAGDDNPGANISGTATTAIHGGLFQQIFGGSDTKGDVHIVALSIDDESGCHEIIQESFGGANKAVLHGHVNTTLLCSNINIGSFYGGSNLADIIDGSVTLNVYGGTYTRVFGGSKGDLANLGTGHADTYANIIGDVTLNIYGGEIDTVFGGSNINGNITGKITVNIIDDESVSNNTPTCPLVIHNVYGGGRDAAYTPSYPLPTGVTERITPVVNLIHGNITKSSGDGGNVFGGAYGATAIITANPKVNIGYDASMNSLIPEGHPYKTSTGGLLATVAGNVYGGGDKAAVAGGTLVTIQKNNSMATSLYGGGNEASVGKATVNVLEGSVSTGVYGGCNTSGTVGGSINSIVFDITTAPTTSTTTSTTALDFDGDIAVNIKNNLGSNSSRMAEGIYGGGKGKDTRTTGDVTVTIGEESNPTLYADVYGGSALGWVGDGNDLTKVDFKNGTLYGNLYGGGMGDNSNAAKVNGNVQVAVSGNTTSIKGTGDNPGIYGGCNVHGTVTGTVTMGLAGGTIGTSATDKANVYGGGLGENTNVQGSVAVTLETGAAIYGDVYGGSAKGLVNSTTVTLGGGTVNGDIYGGGHGLENKAANVLGPVSVTVNSGSVKNVFGCNNEAGAPQSTVQVDINNSVTENVYGGGNLAAYSGSPKVYINNGTIANVFGGGKGLTGQDKAKVTGNPEVTIGDSEGSHSAIVTGNVYGGGDAAQVDGHTSVTYDDSHANSKVGKLFGGGNAAGVTGTAQVAMSNGQVTGGVYGGCNTTGTVGGDITVGITSGTIGTNTSSRANIHGGGYGSATQTSGAVTVNIANSTASSGPTIFGDLYGGSALGQVSASGSLTQVNFYKGTINGDIYGGGLGDPSYAATVSGDVEVNIKGGVFKSATGTAGGGRVFGCNNANGTPKGNVAVNIYATDHGSTAQTNHYPTAPSGGWNATNLASNTSSQTYAIGAVYGGGNEAAYIPATDVTHNTTVHVYYCDNTIEDVFGGGNAADVGKTGTGAVTANTNVIIDGGRIKHVFGGGNGAGTTTGANIYGTATTTLYAGVINQVFGGSNEKGNITTAHLNLAHDNSNTCDMFYGEVFGGGNLAPIVGNLVTTVDCGAGNLGDFYGGANEANITGNVTLNIKGGTFNNVFGGSKGVTNGTAANILDNPSTGTREGNVTLNLYGGTITNAFGGSNYNGNIDGVITVNILDHEGSCPLNVTNIYGAGNLTAYTPKDVTSGVKPTSPVVNVMHIKNDSGISGNVYGGAKGSNTATATVTANPQVTIGYGTSLASYLPSTGFTISEANRRAVVAGNVFGGGDLAPVVGTTKVIIQKDNSSATSLFGGGNQANVGGSTVDVLDGTVSEGVYGGCNVSGIVLGNAVVGVTGGTVGVSTNTTTGIVYGGGLGQNTKVKGNVAVNIGTSVNSTGATIYGDVYGGSAKGLVNCNEAGTALNTGSKTDVTLNVGAIHGDLYGGGHGIDGASAHVYGPVVVTTKGGTVNNVFGCNNAAGAPQGTVKVDINGGTISTNVYGGGNHAYYGGTPDVNILSGTVNGKVFGGGNDITTANEGVNGSDVEMTNGTVKGGVYGGCNERGTVKTASLVKLNGGIVGESTATNTGIVYGGGLGQNTKVKGDVAVTIGQLGSSNGATIYGDVYGGSAKGMVNCNDAGTAQTTNAKTDVTLNVGAINGDLYGGGHGPGNENAHVWGPVVVNVKNGSAKSVYGGNNVSGTPKNTIKVIVEGGTVEYVYGGGNQAAYTSPNVNTASPEVTIKGTGKLTYDVFGGGNQAEVTGYTLVKLQGGANIGREVYGGGNEGQVNGKSEVKIEDE